MCTLYAALGKRWRRNVTIFCGNSNCVTKSIKKSKKVLLTMSSTLSVDQPLDKELELSILSIDECVALWKDVEVVDDDLVSLTNILSTSNIFIIKDSAVTVFIVFVSHNCTRKLTSVSASLISSATKSEKNYVNVRFLHVFQQQVNLTPPS